MDRVIVYVDENPLDTDFLNAQKNAMIGLGMALQAILGTGTLVDGLACAPTGPASLQVVVAPGSIYSVENVDGTAYGSLAADTTHQIVKQGIVLNPTTLSCPAPATTGYAINYLIQVAYQDVDAGTTVLPYYDATDPAVAYNGPNNTGVSQNTVREGQCIIAVKVGTAATIHIRAASPSNLIAHVVYAAQVPQSAPAPAPNPTPAPAVTPAPKPTPKAHPSEPIIIVDGEVRDLTPEERQKLENDLGTSLEQMQQFKIQFDDPAFQKQLAESMKVFDSAEFKKQMEDLKINLKALDDPEFRKQLADAQKLAMDSAFNDPKFKLQMDQMKLQFDSPEFRAQIEQAKALALQTRADADKRSAEMRQQLDEARQAIEEVKKQVHDAKIQQQLEQAQRNIQNATPKD